MLVNNNIKIYNGTTQVIRAYQGEDIIYELSTPSAAHIYGVKRQISSSSPAWERLEDGVGLVANATHDGTAVLNDFDSIYPWSDIISYNYDVNNKEITAYYGDDDFSFNGSNGEVLTKIPEFWWKRYQENDWEYVYIADGPVNGFTKSEEFSVARYLMSSMGHSKNNVKPLGNTRLSQARDYVINNLGTDFCLLDYHYYLLQLLYLVEYATYNSQEALGVGIQSGSATRNLGGCDILGMKSGSLLQTGYGAVIYRGIEDIFGHQFQTLDGMISRENRTIAISYTPTDYSDAQRYILANIVYSQSFGWVNIKEVCYDANNPLIQLPISNTGSRNHTTYICDALYTGNESSVIQVGGSSYYSQNDNGLWCVAIANGTGSAYADMGYRFIKYK